MCFYSTWFHVYMTTSWLVFNVLVCSIFDISLYRINYYIVISFCDDCVSVALYCCSVIHVRAMHPWEAQCKLNLPPPTPPNHPTQDFHVYVHVVPSVRQTLKACWPFFISPSINCYAEQENSQASCIQLVYSFSMLYELMRKF